MLVKGATGEFCSVAFIPKNYCASTSSDWNGTQSNWKDIWGWRQITSIFSWYHFYVSPQKYGIYPIHIFYTGPWCRTWHGQISLEFDRLEKLCSYAQKPTATVHHSVYRVPTAFLESKLGTFQGPFQDQTNFFKDLYGKYYNGDMLKTY